MKNIFTILFIIILVFLSDLTNRKIFSSPLIKISAAYLEDDRLPTISNNDLEEIISSAKRELYKKFGISNVEFELERKEDVRAFFRKYLKKESQYYKDLKKYKISFFKNRIEYKPYLSRITNFLKRNWKLSDLKTFLPASQKIKTYNDFAVYLFKKYSEKIKILKNLKLKSGKYIIDRNDNDINSYINWLVVMYYQDKYDFVFSNTLIVYDNIIEPYPHAILKYAKVGGSSFESPRRELFDGTSAMVNLFEMLTPIKYFKTKFVKKNISLKEWDKIMGAFVMAHELGHMIYLIPDVYDHPKGCLMDSSNENIDYFEGYKLLMKYPEPCPKCKVWVDARNIYFTANRLFKQREFQSSITEYKLALRKTPKKLDIDYNKYISLLYYKIAYCYYELKNYTKTKFYLKKSLKLNFANKKSKKLMRLTNEKE